MSLNALALATLLAGEAEAKAPEVTAAQIDRHCPAVEGSTATRGSVREDTDALNEILGRVLEQPSKREMVQALASELLGAIQAEVPMDGIETRQGLVEATLADQLSGREKVDVNRGIIRDVRKENDRDARAMDLLLNGLRPDKLVKTVMNWDKLAAVYNWAVAEREADNFKAIAGVDCLQAFVTAQRTGTFPAVEADRGKAEEPKWEIPVTIPAFPALKTDGETIDWMLGLGREEEERMLAEGELADLKDQVTTGEERFARRYGLGNAKTPDLNVVITFKEAEEKR